jgi:hypothetical protein
MDRLSVLSYHWQTPKLWVQYFTFVIFIDPLDQGWATRFGSRATLKTNFVLRASPILFYLCEKWAFSSHFSKKKHFAFQMFYQPKKCWRATFRCLSGRMWPAGQTLPRPASDPLHGSLRGPWTQGYERYSTGYYIQSVSRI